MQASHDIRQLDKLNDDREVKKMVKCLLMALVVGWSKESGVGKLHTKKSSLVRMCFVMNGTHLPCDSDTLLETLTYAQKDFSTRLL